MRERPQRLGEVLVRRAPVDLEGGGLHGEVEIGPGVPVGHGVDVERVDLLAGPAEGVEGVTAPAADSGYVEHARRLAARPHGWRTGADVR